MVTLRDRTEFGIAFSGKRVFKCVTTISHFSARGHGLDRASTPSVDMHVGIKSKRGGRGLHVAVQMTSSVIEWLDMLKLD